MKPSKIRNRTIHKPTVSMRSKLMMSHLNKDLRKTYGQRSIRVVPGDSVLIRRGIYQTITGKVEKVDPHRGVAISGIQKEKTEGKKIDIYIHPSNIEITALNTDDKWRTKKLKAKPGSVDTAKQPTPTEGAAKSPKIMVDGDETVQAPFNDTQEISPDTKDDTDITGQDTSDTKTLDDNDNVQAPFNDTQEISPDTNDDTDITGQDTSDTKTLDDNDNTAPETLPDDNNDTASNIKESDDTNDAKSNDTGEAKP